MSVVRKGHLILIKRLWILWSDTRSNSTSRRSRLRTSVLLRHASIRNNWRVVKATIAHRFKVLLPIEALLAIKAAKIGRKLVKLTTGITKTGRLVAKLLTAKVLVKPTRLGTKLLSAKMLLKATRLGTKLLLTKLTAV